MRLTMMILGLSALVSTGCGDDAVGDGGGTAGTTSGSTGAPGSSGAPATTTTTGMAGSSGTSGSSGVADSSGSTAADTTEGDSTGSSGSSEGSESSSGTTDGGGLLEGSMSGLQIFQNCMPIVSADPLGANFSVELVNVADIEASATVVSATFVDAGGAEVATIDVTPEILGPVGGGDNTIVMLSKVPNSLMPAGGCVLTCNTSYTLEVVLDVDGSEQTVSDTAPADCVF